MKTSSICCFLSVFIFSCVGSDDDHDLVRRQSVVFDKKVLGGRTVSQSRVHLRHGELITDPKILSENFQLASISTSSAYVPVNLWSEINGNCVRDQPAAGSANLVGDFSLTTAEHVVQKGSVFEPLFFGGSVEQNAGTIKLFGYWGIDMPGHLSALPNWPYFDNYPPNSDDVVASTFGYDQLEQNIALPERLFQLSMHSRNPGTTEDLLIPNIEAYHNKRQAIGFFEYIVSGRYWPQNLDFAALELKPNRVFADIIRGAEINLSIGTVPFSSPAPFFNRVGFEFYDEGNEDVTIVTPMWATHFTSYPMDGHGPLPLDPARSMDDFRSSLISRNGVLDTTTSISKRIRYCDGPTPTSIDVEVVPAAIDVKGGSSGGGLLTCRDEDCRQYGGDGNWSTTYFPDLLIRGVLTSVVHTANPPQGYSAGDWLEPENYDINNHAAFITPIHSSVRVLSPKEAQVTGCTLGAPCGQINLACQSFGPKETCNSDSDCGNNACVDGFCAPYCEQWETPTESNSIFGKPPTHIDKDHNDGVIDGIRRLFVVSDCSSTMKKDVPVTYTDENGKEISLGGAIGFRGFPSKKGIGGLQTVCGPWNQDSYTENWRWLRKHGPVWAATAFGFQASSFRHKLYEALTRESFALEAAPLRPTPMKLCPPNHMLHGIELNMDNRVIRGVQALDCVAVHPSVSDRSAFRAPLRAPYDNSLGVLDGMQQGYTLNGEVYDLTQYIGYPPMPDDMNGQLVSCKEPAHIVNSVTSAWTDGELTGVWLHCIPPPS